jgi:hypothetical protein
MLIRTIINFTFINDNVLVGYFTETQDTQDTQETDSEEFRELLSNFFGVSENYFESTIYSLDLLSIILPFRKQKKVLSVEQIDNLEKYELYTSCPICMDDKSDNIKLNCQHIFCKDCIKTWLSKQSNTCPICRVTL